MFAIVVFEHHPTRCSKAVEINFRFCLEVGDSQSFHSSTQTVYIISAEAVSQRGRGICPHSELAAGWVSRYTFQNLGDMTGASIEWEDVR